MDESTCEACAIEGRDPILCWRESRHDLVHRAARQRAHDLSTHLEVTC